MKHPLDQRRNPLEPGEHYEPDHEAAGLLRAGRGAWLERTFELARLFKRMRHKRAYVGELCGSLTHFATEAGYDSMQANNLAWLGYALEGCEGLADAIRKNQVMLPKAYEIGKIYARPALVNDKDDWVRIACSSTLSDLRRLVRKRLEAQRQDVESTTTLKLELGPAAKEDFDACRMLASQKARRLLSHSQTAWVLARYHRHAMDPGEQKEGKRRCGPTKEQPHKRSIPSEVNRRLWARSGGICEFGLQS